LIDKSLQILIYLWWIYYMFYICFRKVRRYFKYFPKHSYYIIWRG